MRVRHGTALEITVQLAKYASDVNDVSAITAKVLDRDEDLIADLGAGTIDLGDAVATFEIPATAHELGAGELSAPRALAIVVTVDGVEQYDAIYYSVEGASRLVPPANSFITLTAAHAAAQNMPFASGWANATEDARIAALQLAFYRLVAIPYEIRRQDLPTDLIEVALNSQNGHFSSLFSIILLPDTWELLTRDDMAKLPSSFLRALCMAQMNEAEEILRGDTLETKLKYGIISETIGESSVRLNTRRLVTGISADTLQYLRGYIHYDHRLTR